MQKKIRIKASERRDYIMQQLNLHGEVRVLDLSEELDTTVVTIRKDLGDMERSGLLQRVHGGAVIDQKAEANHEFQARLIYKKNEKKRIASKAANMIRPGESVLLNVGSTTFYIAQELKSRGDIIVITNSFQVLGELGFNKNIALIFLGGRFDSRIQLTYGDDTLMQLKRYKVDKVFMGCDGIDLAKGATTYDHIAAAVHKQMIECANERILVADDTKLGKIALTQIADLHCFETLITTHATEKDVLCGQLEQNGLKVVRV